MISKKKNKFLKGKVIKINNKSIIILLSKIKKHNFYKKFIKYYKKMCIHDENNIAKINDNVLVKYYKPISKKKSWILIKIIN